MHSARIHPSETFPLAGVISAWNLYLHLNESLPLLEQPLETKILREYCTQCFTDATKRLNSKRVVPYLILGMHKKEKERENEVQKDGTIGGCGHQQKRRKKNIGAYDCFCLNPSSLNHSLIFSIGDNGLWRKLIVMTV